jgi:hypothetical protein
MFAAADSSMIVRFEAMPSILRLHDLYLPDRGVQRISRADGR